MRDLPMRKNIRLRGYDYSQNAYYFITICAKNRELLFGNIVDGVVELNDYGKIAKNELLNIENHYNHIKIDTFIVMPNHIHLIIRIVGVPLAAPDENENDFATVNAPAENENAPAENETGRASAPPTTVGIGNVVRGYKSGVSKNIGFSIWQRNYHDHIIRNEESYQRIYRYINENPQKWENDCYYEK